MTTSLLASFSDFSGSLVREKEMVLVLTKFFMEAFIYALKVIPNSSARAIASFFRVGLILMLTLVNCGINICMHIIHTPCVLRTYYLDDYLKKDTRPVRMLKCRT